MFSAGLAMMVVALGATLITVFGGALEDEDTPSTKRDRVRQAPGGTGRGMPGHDLSSGTTPSTR